MRLALAAAAVFLAAEPATADGLKQVGDRYWIALASRQSADEAEGTLVVSLTPEGRVEVAAFRYPNEAIR